MPAGWTFVRRPFWLFSHFFAASVIISFVLLGFWQLTRHNERASFNERVEARSAPPAEALADVLDQPATELDYRFVSGSGTYLDGDFVRVANRTQGGVAGQHLVGLFELDDGRLLLVNRGFVPLAASADEIVPAPSGSVPVTGWLRSSAEKGWLGATDTGEGDIVPRLDVAAIAERIAVPAASDGEGRAEVADVWLQLGSVADGDSAELSTFPDPVPLPSIDGGPHLSYMAQWLVFATLGVLFYGALLRRVAKGKHRRAPTGPSAEVSLDVGPGTDPVTDAEVADPVG